MSCPRPATAVRLAACALATALAGGLTALPVDCADARAALASAPNPPSGTGPAQTSSAGSGEAGEEFEAYAEGEEEEVQEGSASAGPTGTSASAREVSGQTVAVEEGAGSSVVRVSSLKLVRSSAEALAHRAVRVSQVRFAFTLSAAARVRVVLARASDDAGEVRWHALRDTVTLGAARGRNRARLRASGVLSPGEYRLTLLAARGNGRSILIRVS